MDIIMYTGILTPSKKNEDKFDSEILVSLQAGKIVPNGIILSHLAQTHNLLKYKPNSPP
jgi:hypothetical protein